MGHSIKSDGVRTKSQVVNIDVITRSRSLKDGSESNINKNPSDECSFFGEKSSSSSHCWGN
jgi:hypothetical protein